MKIVQFGLAYSPNVGDGIIAECLSHEIRSQRPDATVASIDLSGRTEFGEVVIANRSLALAVLRRLPRPLRQRLVSARLQPMLDGMAPRWNEALRDADLAILGGGQLFSDADLNFPLKVAQASKLARASGVPLAIYAVGVAHNWTPRGAELFARVVQADLRQITTRDAHSKTSWQTQMGRFGPTPQLARDPGLLAASCYGPAVQTGAAIGLCVADPAILSYHAEDAVTGSTDTFLPELTQELTARGHSVVLFCNGAAEDRAELARLTALPALRQLMAEGRIHAAPSPKTPTDLARILAGLGAVVAHRLHALIVGYAYRHPIVGLGWDRKVESFLNSVDEQTGFVPAHATVSQTADALDAALIRGIPKDRHTEVLTETRAGITGLLNLI